MPRPKARLRRERLVDNPGPSVRVPTFFSKFLMANTRSAAKRARQTITRTTHNKRVITSVKTRLKAARDGVKAGAKDAARALIQKLSSTVDKAAKTGRIHRNKANRLKSRTAKAVAKLA